MEEVQSVEKIINSFPFFGIVGVAIFANAFPGLPEEVFLLVVGYLVGTGSLNFWITAVSLIVGLLLMDCLLFALSLRGFKFLKVLQKKLLGEGVLENQSFIKKHIDKILFFSRFALYIRWIGPVLAGSIKISWKRFIMTDLVALCVYVPTMLLLGIYFRSRISKIIEGVNAFGNILFMVVIAGVLLAIVLWGKKKFKQKLVATAHGEYPRHNFLGFSWRPKKIKPARH